MTGDEYREWRLMTALRDEPKCRGCDCDKGRLVLCWGCRSKFRDAGIELRDWIISFGFVAA
jgi:hypothetical protein